MPFLLLLLLDGAVADTRASHRSTSSTNAEKDAGNLIVQGHHRHLSTYADGGLDQACWYNKAFVTCAAARPNPTSQPITTTIVAATAATITTAATTTITAAAAATATGARTTSGTRS